MKRPSPLLLLLTVCCAAVLPACAQAPIPHAVRIGSIEELQAYFTYDPGRDIIVSGHRGGMMPGYPENCIESCEKTLSMMPTFFEVDFSFTRDSVMVLMHDLTIDRTTTGKGRVADYTYAELQQFCLVDRDRNVTPYKIPRLKDLLEWGKDKVVFNFDNKYINTRGVSDEVRRASLDYYIKQLQPGGDWSMYHNIMLSVRSVEEAMRANQTIFLVAQRDLETDDPKKADLYEIGTVATVKQILRLPGDNMRILVEGQYRAKLLDMIHSEPYLFGRVLELDALGYRVETDHRSEKIGFKIRQAQLEKVPYMLVVGDKEAETGDVAVRNRHGEQTVMSFDAFAAKLRDEVDSKALEQN